jgi:glycosyltransferase involved in cell wall biosynthesis
MRNIYTKMTAALPSLGETTICLVTPGQPSTNPRLVKEADALVEAGAEVHVVACKFEEWADDADDSFDDRAWTTHWLRFGTQAPRWLDLYQRARRRACREFSRLVGPQVGLAEQAFHYVIPELTKTTSRIPADLYIAHNLAALPPACRAARQQGAKLGFDAEDFHRGQFAGRSAQSIEQRLTEHLEVRHMPHCDYLTAASDGIGAAYAETLDVPPPTTILNVFPWSDRDVNVPRDGLDAETPDGARSLYWFSQTIGPDRGLQDALRALPRLPENVVLSLRGQWAPGYESEFREQARALGVHDRVRHLDLVPPEEVIVRTAEHDIGLALEHPVSQNRRICVTNKLFTYLLAGIPFVATETPGQRPIVQDVSDAARGYAPGDVDGFIAAAESLLDDAESARRAALRAAKERYSWDVEKKTFLTVVSQTLNEQ